ncbi:hypothetical protein [Hymenobacter sp. GOD-10R]|uniref:hypothetical protein n=1 Tax=Hymenobacter sp. GOD-10R TaxID=3093922 RepID=UPI002D789E67|nr:hypothetical protein [Hymenobacter sp. GOD-10R]WRQ28989.1 hypothetical protein SD425_01765 [Hymenobacter sp. GOD-10R]
MKTAIMKGGLLIGVALALSSYDIPTGWFVAGSQPKKYEMGVDQGAGQAGKNAATIRSIDAAPNGFGTLMQNSAPGKYLGKRIRMTGYMKAKEVKGWAGFWLRVDQAGSQRALSFDNMSGRALKGTSDWKKYEIVLDVPAQASNIAYGALLDDAGQIWFDNLNFEVVDTSVPTTDKAKMLEEPKEPKNLSFEE